MLRVARLKYVRAAAEIPSKILAQYGETEEGARAAIAARDALKLETRGRGQMKYLAKAFDRLRGESRGKTFEKLSESKSYREIIDGAGRTNPGVNRFFHIKQ